MAFGIAKAEALAQLAKRLAKGELTQAQVKRFRSHVENMSPQSLISAGFLNPALEPNKTNIKRSINALFRQAEGSPAAMRRENARTFSDQMNQFRDEPLPERRIVTPEQIADEKRVMIPNISDQSATDRRVTHIGGFQLREPIWSRGGMDFSRKMNDPRVQHMLADEGILDRIAWASNESAMRAQQNQANRIWDKFDSQGYTPLAVNTVLDTRASDFPPTYANGLVQIMQDYVKLPKSVAKAFDDEIRAGKQKMKGGKPVFTKSGAPVWEIDRAPFPEWKGINHPDALKQLSEVGGGKRQTVARLAFSPAWQAEGFPARQAFDEAFNLPEMVRGATGYSMYNPVRNAPLIETPDWLHNAYSHLGQGDYYGGLEAPVAPRTAWPETIKSYEDRGKTESDAIGAFMANGSLFELPTSKWVKENTEAVKHNAKLIAQFGSLAAAVRAGYSVADESNPIADLRASEAQFGMSPQERAIADLRASEAGFGNQQLADAYTGASNFWNNVGTSLKGAGVPDLAVDLMQPSYESSAAQAAGDNSTMTGIFSFLEKLDPVGYLGLLDEVRRRK